MERTGHFDKSCLYSTVKNTSGKTMKFAFLPPHGVELENNEEYTVFGNILDAIWQGMRIAARRSHQAFAAALDRGDLTIINTPAPILLDAFTGGTQMLHLNNGSLSAINPCWETSDSLDVNVAA